MLADACVNAAVIIGQELFVEQCRAMDLSTVRAHLNVNGESKSTGTGHDVNGEACALATHCGHLRVLFRALASTL